MANITVTFADGQPHTYQNVPDNVTPDQIEQRAAQDFAGRKVQHLDRQAGQPSAPVEAAQPAKEPSLLERFIERQKNAAIDVGKNVAAGAADIGATILSPFDALGLSAYTTSQRRQAINEFAGDSGVGQTARVLTNIAGTAGAGNLLAKGVQKVAPLVPEVATALRTGGFSTGAPAARALSMGGARNAAIRIGGGAASGAAMAGAINPEDAGTGAVIGGALPVAAKLAGKAGSAIRRATQPKEVIQAVKEARNLGYVIPPTQAKPTLANRLIEGFSGKLTTAQNASARNADVTNALAAKSIGLAPDTKITPDVLRDLRKTAGQAYDAIGQTGTITPSLKYTQEMDKIAAPFIKTSQGFPNAKASPVIELIESLKSPSFDSSAAVEKIKQLRTAADDAFRSGNTDIARASKSAAGVMEDAVEAHLQSVNSPELLQNFRDARQLIAKTYTVEKALNPSTGSIDAKKLGAMLKRGKPLTAELKQAGEFANRFPKAAQTVEGMGSLPQSSPLDWSAAGIASFLAGNPLPMAGVMARPAARKLALSDLVQNRLAVQPMQRSGNRLADLLENPATRAGLLSYQSR